MASSITANGNITTTSDNDASTYSIQKEASLIFQEHILKNPLIAPHLPTEALPFSTHITFTGPPAPSIPIPWRLAESISALKALEATLLNVLLARKYHAAPQRATINTDHASLFVMAPLLLTIDPHGAAPASFRTIAQPAARATWDRFFPSCDIHRSHATPWRLAATNIYRCGDGRYFHLHASLNPEPVLRSLGLPMEGQEAGTQEMAWEAFEEKVGRLGAEELQRLQTEEYRQAGTICWSLEEFANSEHGKANAHVGLWETRRYPELQSSSESMKQPPCWWPDLEGQTGTSRPLAGLKVLDLTRIIAAPAMTKGLAEMGASVLRVTGPLALLPDLSSVHPDVNWGKWCAVLDLREEEGRQKIKELVMEADVVVMGYRPGVLDKYGLSVEGILDMCKGRERGIIVARENCYGWYGPWKDRSGWQQISDANCGVSMEYGRAMGLDEPVTPIFPNSDYCTGVIGTTAILDAVIRRGKDGGSYVVDLALNYYSFWLTRFVGTYPAPVWEAVWSKHGKPVFHAHHNMHYTMPRMVGLLAKNTPGLFEASFFEDRESRALGTTLRVVKPVAQFQGEEDQGATAVVRLGFNVGTRGNGVDAPKWPADLMTEIVV